MATLLYRVGAWCARKAPAIMIVWLMILALAGAAALVFAKGTSSQYSVPDAPYQRVLDEMNERMPEATFGSGTVAFRSADGQAFTEKQRSEITAALNGAAEDVPVISSVTDPFETQEQLDGAARGVSDGQQQLESGREELERGERELAQQRDELDRASQELDRSLGQLPGNPDREEAAQLNPELADQIDQLEAGQRQLQEGETQLRESRQELDSRSEELTAAQRRTALTEEQRFVTQDGSVARGIVDFAKNPTSMSGDEREQVTSAISGGLPAGVMADYSVEITQDVSGLVGSTEIIGIVVAALVLFIVLGTIVMAGLPVASAVIGCGTGVALVYALSSVVDMTATDPVLALMLGMGLGIDYALLITHRHRTNLLDGIPLRESIARATGTAGTSVLFAGLTNVIALAALATVGIPFLGTMGLAGAGTVMLVILASVTVTPALLSLVGPRAVPAKTWRERGFTEHGEKAAPPQGASPAASAEARSARSSAHEQAERIEAEVRRSAETAGTEPGAMALSRANKGWGAFVTRHPIAMIAVAVLVLLALALPAMQLRLGLPDGAAEPPGSTANTAYHAVSENFGEGANAPIVTMVSLPEENRSREQADAAALDVSEYIAGMEGVVTAVPATISDDFRTALVTVTPETGPADARTEELVTELRDQREAIQDATGTDVGFTGQTVANIDISDTLNAALPVYMAIVLVLCLVIMLLVFRSIWVPVMATLGFIFSTVASFGAVVMVYQMGWGADFFGVHEPGPILAFLPILLVGVLFGLSVDYQIFIVSGMREAYMRGFEAHDAVRVGYRQGGTVVTACGVIMVSVFAGFIFAHVSVVRPIGFALAFGVAMDAFLIRTTFIPATMQLLGKHAWWLPRWLDRILPNVDVEGEKLNERLAAEDRKGRELSNAAG
ncbi:MAG: MMPL family transporter [Kocuria sp.]|nr:MMPL family transporter [Kocuria sp.]